MQDLGSRAGIAKAKFEIIQGMQEDGLLFYDGDEPLQGISGKRTVLQSVPFGLESNNLYTLTIFMLTLMAKNFTTHGMIEGDFFISVLGQASSKNTLVAMLISHKLGLSNEQIRTSLEHRIN